MKTAWMTYSWADNAGTSGGDVDFLIQEIERHRVSVRIDRRDLVVGKPLWPQIEQHISDPNLCDAWLYVVTPNSLASKPCREELLYALDRALDKRHDTFPIIGIFLGQIPDDIPKALSVRLCVSTDEINWAGRVAAGVKQRPEPTQMSSVHSFHHHLCNNRYADGDHVFEIRPRLGVWAPFVFGLREGDADRFKGVTYAPSTAHTNCTIGHQSGSSYSSIPDEHRDGYLWRGVTHPVLTASMAAHVFLRLDGKRLEVKFGVLGGEIHTVTLEPYSG